MCIRPATGTVGRCAHHSWQGLSRPPRCSPARRRRRGFDRLPQRLERLARQLRRQRPVPGHDRRPRGAPVPVAVAGRRRHDRRRPVRQDQALQTERLADPRVRPATAQEHLLAPGQRRREVRRDLARRRADRLLLHLVRGLEGAGDDRLRRRRRHAAARQPLQRLPRVGDQHAHPHLRRLRLARQPARPGAGDRGEMAQRQRRRPQRPGDQPAGDVPRADPPRA